jgi:endo-1,4-beta-xylanase
MNLTRREFAAASSAFALSACAGGSGPGSAEQPGTSEPAAGAEVPSLGQALAPHFPFGAAITPGQVLFGSDEFIKRQFTIAVAENAMKPDALAKKGEGQYDFSAADDLVNFVRGAGMRMRGHTLIWHQQMPAWFFFDNGELVSRAVLIARMERYIADVVGHFKGRVYAWDVVNEAYSFGESNVATDANGMRMSRFREIVGEEFIEIAFRAAAKADPDALLFYNDYETQDPRKIAAISAMVTRLKAAGVKIDGLGHQAHCSMLHPSVASLEFAIEDYARLGVTQHVTELDIALNDDISANRVAYASPELLARQAQRYAEFFQVFIKHRKDITAVLVWGIDDANTWLKYWPTNRFEAPLLFDERRQPKPAFWSVLKVAKAA